MLSDGFAASDIEQSLGLAGGFVRAYLAKRSQLRGRWASANTLRVREQYRQQVLCTLELNPMLPIKTIRRLPKNGFQWQHVHDREWLQGVLPAIWHR
jgi:hypothetical protein